MRVGVGALLITTLVAAAACRSEAPQQSESTAASAPAADASHAGHQTAQSQVERGRMLIIGGGCHDCHTPKKIGPNGPEADMSLALSGHPEKEGATPPFKQDPKNPYTVHINDHLTAWSGAWGVSYAANLTPDQNTGLGIWTEEMFLNALKQGKHMGTSRAILPPMPWYFYGQLPDDDLKAMFAYLKSLPPIQNRVPIPLNPAGQPIEQPQ